MQFACADTAFPKRPLQWLSEPARRSQWRDRAGFTPDFPITPERAPANWFQNTTVGRGPAAGAGRHKPGAGMRASRNVRWSLHRVPTTRSRDSERDSVRAHAHGAARRLPTIAGRQRSLLQARLLGPIGRIAASGQPHCSRSQNRLLQGRRTGSPNRIPRPGQRLRHRRDQPAEQFRRAPSGRRLAASGTRPGGFGTLGPRAWARIFADKTRSTRLPGCQRDLSRQSSSSRSRS